MIAADPTRLSAAFIDVVQRQAFLFAEPTAVKSLAEPDSGWVHARIAFSGPVSGRLELDLAGELRREIAANVLGLESDDDAAERGGDDALRELLNVICGHLLTQMAGEAAVFDLGLPEVDPPSENPPDFSPRALAFDVEGHPMVLHLAIASGT